MPLRNLASSHVRWRCSRCLAEWPIRRVAEPLTRVVRGRQPSDDRRSTIIDLENALNYVLSDEERGTLIAYASLENIAATERWGVLVRYLATVGTRISVGSAKERVFRARKKFESELERRGMFRRPGVRKKIG